MTEDIKMGFEESADVNRKDATAYTAPGLTAIQTMKARYAATDQHEYIVMVGKTSATVSPELNRRRHCRIA